MFCNFCDDMSNHRRCEPMRLCGRCPRLLGGHDESRHRCLFPPRAIGAVNVRHVCGRRSSPRLSSPRT